MGEMPPSHTVLALGSAWAPLLRQLPVPLQRPPCHPHHAATQPIIHAIRYKISCHTPNIQVSETLAMIYKGPAPSSHP